MTLRGNKKIAAILLIAVAVVLTGRGIPALAQSQGTEGTEIHVIEPEQLQIQLGKEWAGTRFQLKTDSGLYPGTITVGEDGVLRTEIGGSKNYILTCLGVRPEEPAQALVTESSAVVSGVAISGTAVSATSVSATAVSGAATESKTPKNEAGNDSEQGKLVAGIPIKHLVIFLVGMAAAVSTLVVLQIRQRKSLSEYEDDEEDED